MNSLRRAEVSKLNDKELEVYLAKNEEDIELFEVLYFSTLKRVAVILSSNEFWHLALENTFEEILGDTIHNLQPFIDHVAHFALKAWSVNRI